jgi:hypothetical protein
MEVNLTDWLGENLLGDLAESRLPLGVAEIMSLDLVLIMLAVGQWPWAVVATGPSLWWLQILVARVSLSMLLLLRPTLLAKVAACPAIDPQPPRWSAAAG